VLAALLAAALDGTAAFADRLPERSTHIADYTIGVSLDTNSKELDGRQLIVWRNPSQDHVGDLWFHLYLNAFRFGSTLNRGSGAPRSGDEHPGWIEVTSLIADGRDLTERMRFEQPDDGNLEDRTVMRVVLPEPVPPGGELSLDLTFRARLPPLRLRTGHDGDSYMVAQWFPKLGVYEPAGKRGRTTGGWNCHQFHANTEFYANFGHYLVDITLPTRFVVGATGDEKRRVENGDGTTTWTFEQADVHDFAWTADPRYVEVRHTFSATRDVSPEEYAATARLLGRTLEEVRLSDVEIIFLMRPQHMRQLHRHVEAARAAIKYFGLWYGRYPYRTLTVVDAAPGGGGMEYPTLITVGTSFLLNRGPLARVLVPEMVLIHEFGHQYWYGMVASNEFEEAWLDEGLTSYSTTLVMERLYGSRTSFGSLLGLPLSAREVARLQNTPDKRYHSVLQPAWTMPSNVYGFYAYAKPELVLHTLENHLGVETMARVMRTYHERWRFGHPSSDDFFAVVNEVSRRDMGWYFDQAIRRPGVLDYEVASVSTRRLAPSAAGEPDAGEKAAAETATQADDLSMKSTAEAGYSSTIVVRRRGDLFFPVEVALKFEGQPPERLHWDGRDPTVTYRMTRPGRLEWADVDPDRKILLDIDWLNNSRRVEPDRRTAAAWSSRWMFWVQNIVAFLGF
jgi:hypothetical protein